MSSTVESRQEAVDAIHAEVFADRIARRGQSRTNGAQPHPLNRDDSKVIELASNAKNRDHFLSLFRDGDVSRYGGDDSAADLALASMLAFWTGGNAAQIERIFSQSALAQRSKWGRPDYRERTIAAALAGTTEFYGASSRTQSMNNHTAAAGTTEAFSKSESADGKSKSKGYSWDAISAPEFIAQGDNIPETLIPRLSVPGMMTLISGTRGLGKTNLGLALSVAAATGSHFLGQELRAMRVLYLNRDNPTALLRRRLKSWGAANAPNLKILGRDKAAPFTAKDVWEKFPLDEYDLGIIDSQSAFLEAVDEKEGGVNGDAIASVLDAAATTETAFIILSNTKRSGKAYRGSGVIADRADITYEARDATDLRHDARKESWFECLPNPSDEEWLSRAKRRKGRQDYRVAFICAKFREADEPDPFCVEICHDDDAGWSVREVTEEVVAKHEETCGAAERRRQERETEAIAALKAALPLPKNPDAFQVLKAHDVQRNRARKLIDERAGHDWLLTGSGRKKDPIMLVPVSGQESAVNPDDGGGPRCPCGHAESEHSDSERQVEGRTLYMWECSRCACSCGPYSRPRRVKQSGAAVN